jgi:ABC-type antimicrobial peptide transport system permease subunit
MAVGLVFGGTAGALGATVLRAFLAGVGPTDPLALVAVIVVVGGAALAASTLPALRATRVDPMVALRDT